MTDDNVFNLPTSSRTAIEREVADVTKASAEIDSIIRPALAEVGCHYALVIWTKGDPGFCRYVSSVPSEMLALVLRQVSGRIGADDPAVQRAVPHNDEDTPA